MKLLPVSAFVLLALGVGAFVVGELYAAVTVVPWQETWRVQRVHVWHASAYALLGGSAALFVALGVGRLRRRAG